MSSRAIAGAGYDKSDFFRSYRVKIRASVHDWFLPKVMEGSHSRIQKNGLHLSQWRRQPCHEVRIFPHR